jgi:choline dehydrogenase-like flavoprotein
VRAASLSGRTFRVRARLVVLAAGGIENARLLLLTDVADESGLVGRCFMEHPRDRSRRLVPADRALFARCGLYDLHRGAGGTVMGRLTFTDEARRRLELPAMSVTLQPLARARRLGPRRHEAFELLINLEQAPDPDNRVTLGEARDRFGLPVPAIHWRWRAIDQRGLARVHAILAEELERRGLGRVEAGPEAPLDPNAHHHMGTTRMHRDPRRGVVDEHARVHGMANIFVAGSSVFPTSGFANPTLTIVALALRLAEHLDKQLR